MWFILNEIFCLQILIFIVLFYFIITINIITLWYLAGLYLISSGILLLLDDGDIFIGFLWIIDLGVGLIFFIFILHFSNFLYQKTIFAITKNFFFSFFFFLVFLFSFFFFLANTNSLNFNYDVNKSWFFLLSWYDYYNLYYLRFITNLNVIRELYFYNNSLEFFIINFAIFYGIFSAINLTFLIKKIFNFLTYSQFNNFFLKMKNNTNLFIRNQNFIRQQNTSAGTRVWNKNKNFQI